MVTQHEARTEVSLTDHQINAQVGLSNIKQLTTHWSFIVKTDLLAKSVFRLPKQVLEKQALVFSDGMTMYFSGEKHQIGVKQLTTANSDKCTCLKQRFSKGPDKRILRSRRFRACLLPRFR